jgi:putative peptidoglycan lipid II flippase
MDADAETKKTSFAGTAGLVMVAFVLSRALGLVREALLGSAFGAGAALDAFRAASRVTDTLYLLIAGGALGSAFIPTFTAYLARGRRASGWCVASAITTLIALVTTIASLLTAVIAPWLVARVLAPGYDAPTQALTVSLLRWMLPSTVIFGVSGLLMGILNANERFLLPALAPSLYNLGIIAGVVLARGQWGVHSAALGTVAGALCHLLVQLPDLRRMDWHYRPMLGLRLAGVREVGRLMGPRVLGMAITQLNFWVNTNLGSRIPVAGVVTALTYGWLLMLLPQGIFAQAIAVVLFPSLSAQAARGERDAMRATVGTATRALLYLTLPATVGLILLRKPLVALLFVRGAFDLEALGMVAWALAWYAIGLVAHSALEVVTRAFYALHDTATPVWVGGGAMVANVGLSLLLMQLFAPLTATLAPWAPLGGLALANSLATAGETLVLALLLGKRLGGLEGRQFLRSLQRAAVGSAAMGAALAVLLRTTPAAQHTSSLGAWALGGGGMLLGAAVYAFVTVLVGAPEIDLVLDAVRRRRGQ